MKRIAYLISVYRDAPHVQRLVRALDDGAADFYLHVDKKADARPFLEALPGCTFVNRRWVNWGGWQQVGYQEEMLKAALHSGKDYEWLVCLSGQDFPLLSPEGIRRFLAHEPGREWIAGMNLTRQGSEQQRRKVTRYHLLRDVPVRNRWWRDKLIAGFRLLMAVIPRRKRPTVALDGKACDVYFGSDYWALSQDCARYVYRQLCSQRAFRRYFRTAFVPSELCIQTLVFNSPFASRALLVEGAYRGLESLSPLHFLTYGRQIATLTLQDLPRLQACGKPFARKVVSGASDALVQALPLSAPMADKVTALSATEAVPRIMVIIVSYNFEPWIERCLSSLRHSFLKPMVVVVDNASTDRTVEIIRTQYPEVRLVCNEQNRGFGQANNQAMRWAVEEGCDAVFLLNQDAWIDEHVLGRLWQLAQEHPQYGLLSPVHLCGDGQALDHGFATYTHLHSAADLPDSAAHPVVEAAFINAAFWLIPTAVLRRVGGFCPLFYHYGEDVDFVNRLHYHGYRVGYHPGVYGYHDRQHRRVDDKTFFRSEQIYFLTELANLQHNTLQAVMYSLGAAVKKAFRRLLHNDVAACREYLRIALRLGGRLREALRYRRQNRRPPRPSLYLD